MASQEQSANSDSFPVPDVLIPLLQRTGTDPRPIVVMTCGISGAGKTTLAKAITTTKIPQFTRLSIDTIIHARHGLYGIDYPRSAYATYQDEATAIFRFETMQWLLAAAAAATTTKTNLTKFTTNLVLDRSFYAKADRDEYRALAEDAGARVVLVFLDADRDVLWRRIGKRWERRAEGRGVDADSAMDVTEEVLDAYLAGFERPSGEGEVVIRVT